jgi:hypothetical protein
MSDRRRQSAADSGHVSKGERSAKGSCVAVQVQDDAASGV